MEHRVLLRDEPGENAMRNPMQINLGLWCFHPIFSTFGSSRVHYDMSCVDVMGTKLFATFCIV